jgi:membrane protease YdiL (CAAX protease family)
VALGEPLVTSPRETIRGRRDVRTLHPLTVLATGVAVTALAVPESWRGWPYAPFPILHATLAIAVALWFRAGPTRPARLEIHGHLPELGRPAAAAIAFIGGFVVLYSVLLVALGKEHDPAWNLIATYRDLGKLFIARYGRPEVLVISYILVGLWPMFGEELFYRGFMLRGLLEHVSPAPAAITTSTLFGFRHAAQLTYLLPSYPTAAGVAYFLWGFGLSMIWCWVYLRTRSLWLCIASHGVNIVLVPAMLAVLVR